MKKTHRFIPLMLVSMLVVTSLVGVGFTPQKAIAKTQGSGGLTITISPTVPQSGVPFTATVTEDAKYASPNNAMQFWIPKGVQPVSTSASGITNVKYNSSAQMMEFNWAPGANSFSIQLVGTAGTYVSENQLGGLRAFDNSNELWYWLDFTIADPNGATGGGSVDPTTTPTNDTTVTPAVDTPSTVTTITPTSTTTDNSTTPTTGDILANLVWPAIGVMLVAAIVIVMAATRRTSRRDA